MAQIVMDEGLLVFIHHLINYLITNKLNFAQ